MQQFDLVVVGNGSAGDNIARTLGRKGRRVAVVERHLLGGECLNDGCVPSKALIEVARRARQLPIGWDRALAHVRAVQLTVRGSDPDGGFEADGVTLIRGDATFVAPRRLRVGDQELEARDVVIATGTSPAIPPIPGLAEARPQTNRTVFTLPELPRRLAVIGAGPIGLELGQSFLRLGSDVTIFETARHCAIREDVEVSIELERLLSKDGLRIITQAEIERVDRAPDGTVAVTTPSGIAHFDDILVAAGREAQVPGGLDELGLERDRHGFVRISPCGRTNLDGLWAAGDVTGKFLFTHYASYQAHHIAKHLDQGVCEPIPDVLVPWAIFTDPEVGHAGMTEEQAKDQGRDVRIARLDASELDWFRTTGQPDGFAKVIVDAESGVLLGAHFVCARGSTLVGEACLAIQHGLTARQVASTIHPYPTASELFRWACARAV
jgi:pyruvate/2-oxoglutarate dehydrogenase complex dihydrolipoamide dehydrogenase (E3) component